MKRAFFGSGPGAERPRAQLRRPWGRTSATPRAPLAQRGGAREPAAHGPLALWSLSALLVVAWGLNFVFGKFAVRGFAPAVGAPAFAATGARIILAAALPLPLLLFARFRPGNSRAKSAAESPAQSFAGRLDWRLLALLGVTGITCNQLFFVWGLAYTSAADAALLQSLTPLLVLLLARRGGQEAITPAKLGGMILALAGVAVIVGHGLSLGGAAWGDFLELLSALSFTIYTVAGKPLAGKLDTWTFTLATYALGALAALPLVLPSLVQVHWARVTASGWWGVLYMSLIGSLLAYWIFYDLMKTLTAAQVSTLNYLQPVVAALAGWWLLAEPLTPELGVGGAAILLGVWWVERR